MSEQDKVFRFINGLQTWARTELNRQGVTCLGPGADRLVDYTARMLKIKPRQRARNSRSVSKKTKDGAKKTFESKGTFGRSSLVICSGGEDRP